MLYQLPTGKTIEISFEEWYTMTDDDEKNLIAYGDSFEINNAFHHSALTDKPGKQRSFLDEEEELSIDLFDEVNLIEEDQY